MSSNEKRRHSQSVKTDDHKIEIRKRQLVKNKSMQVESTLRVVDEKNAEVEKPFAYLSGDIVYDVLHLELNYSSISAGLFDNISKINGVWGDVARNISHHSLHFTYDCWNVMRRPGEPIAYDDNFKKNCYIFYADIDCTRGPATSIYPLVPRMRETIRIKGEFSISLVLQLPTDRFTQFSLFIPYDTPSIYDQDEQKSLEDALLRLMDSKHMRSFTCGGRHLFRDRVAELEEHLCRFVKKPHFEKISISTVVDQRVVDAALEAWRTRTSFPGPVQRINIPTRFIVTEEERALQNPLVDWTDGRQTRVRYPQGSVEYHPTDPERKVINQVSFFDGFLDQNLTFIRKYHR
uniref:Uncharacterized protein n=1 Tax=Steinernema glaseri TaxID=37863 RepID=A0A1I7YY75_9BILA